MENPSGMRVLILDIETSPIDAFTWGLWQQNVGLSQVKAPTRMLSWAAKWEGEDEVMYASERNHSHEDMVMEIYDLVNEADAIVHYNGTAFDMKHLNREFVEIGLPPPLKYKNIDLLRVVKSQFKFPSNKLDYVAGVLLGEHKMDTGGFGLWVAVLNGDDEAWRKMEDYNIEDVLLTERLYHRVQGWVPGHPNRALWVADQSAPICPNCGSAHLVKKGVERPARVNAYQRYKCSDCGANSRGREIVTKAGPGVLM
jgi:DNA polymerase elongation subunit (family B)/DNA-directed RNA polymerase subunit RPC12/RpoP